MKWGVVLAGASDFLRPADKLSLTQNLALMATGSIWTRWCFVIRPQNMLYVDTLPSPRADELLTINAQLGGSQLLLVHRWHSAGFANLCISAQLERLDGGDVEGVDKRCEGNG